MRPLRKPGEAITPICKFQCGDYATSMQVLIRPFEGPHFRFTHYVGFCGSSAQLDDIRSRGGRATIERPNGQKIECDVGSLAFSEDRFAFCIVEARTDAQPEGPDDDKPVVSDS